MYWPLCFFPAPPFVCALMIRLAVLVCVAAAAVCAQNTHLIPVAGCWEMLPRGKGCAVHWGYQTNEHDLTVPVGMNNYMLLNHRQSPAVTPITRFFGRKTTRDAFVTHSPCDAPLEWHLNGHVAHARVGHSSHHCYRAFSENDALSGLFPVVPAQECVQHSLNSQENENCLRVDHGRRADTVQLLDASLSLLPRGCVAGASVPVTLSWSVKTACNAPNSVTQKFVAFDVPCRAHELHFGVDSAAPTMWTLADALSGTAMHSVHEADDLAVALWRAVRRANATDLLYYTVAVHADGMQAHLEGAVVRMCYAGKVTTAARFEPMEGTVTPFVECTSRLDVQHGGNADGTMCRSWFGYTSTATVRQHRLVSTQNTFTATPFDRGQPVYFSPGTQHYVFSVVWNCSDHGEPLGPSITWSLDATATATRRGPMCRVGCDGKHDSSLEYDRCGVCGGTGQTCDHPIRGRNSEKLYCDGDHERVVTAEFRPTRDAPQSVVSFKQHNFTAFALAPSKLVIVDTTHPPKERAGLGTPNEAAAKGGPGVGAGGRPGAPGANPRALPGALAFAPTGNASACMLIRFDVPVHLHSITLLNVAAFCKAPTTAAAPTNQVQVRRTQPSALQRLPESDRSWIALYTSGADLTTPVRRESVPPSAANNGVAEVDLLADAVGALEVCMCDGAGAVVALDYLYPGSAAVHDRCGVCGGDGTSCQYAPTTTARIQTRLGVQPITIRAHPEDDNDEYEMCYFHARTSTDTPLYSDHLVRVAFERHTPCSLTVNGTCDSIAGTLDPVAWCTQFDGTHYANGWRRELLGDRAPCYGDALFSCPVGDGSAGYRVCRNFTLAQLVECRTRGGDTAMTTTITPDHRVRYSGTLHVSELVPTDCGNPRLCERVLHQASYHFAVLSTAGGALSVDVDSDNLRVSAEVTGVTCGASASDGVRVHFTTRVALAALSSASNSLYLDTPMELDYTTPPSSTVVAGRRALIVPARMEEADGNPCVEHTTATVVCTQLWVAQLPHAEASLTIATVAHTDAVATPIGPLVMRIDASVPCESVTASATGVRRNEAHLVDSTLVLYRDAERTHAYIPDVFNDPLNSALDGSTLYGRIETAFPADPSLGGEHIIVLDEFSVCYPRPGKATRNAVFVPYDVIRATTTGCQSPGDWLVSRYSVHDRITPHGKLVAFKSTVTGDTIDFEFTAQAVTSRSSLYIDARWHVEWRAEATAEQFAASRVSHHRAHALANGRRAHDWQERSSVFHMILQPHEMEATRSLPSHQRTIIRRQMVEHTLEHTGLSKQALMDLMLWRVTPHNFTDVTRRYGAYNDATWYSGAHSYYQTQCAQGFAPAEQYMPPVYGTCTPCSGSQCDVDLQHSVPCTWGCYNYCWEYGCDYDNSDAWVWLIVFIPFLFVVFFFVIWALTPDCWGESPPYHRHAGASSTTTTASARASRGTAETSVTLAAR